MVRDFGNNWQIGGDFNFHEDRGNLGRPLPELDNDQLRSEFSFRKERHSEEFRRRILSFLIGLAIIGVLGGVAALFFYQVGDVNAVTLVCGLLAVLGLIADVLVFMKPNEHEKEHKVAQRQIKWILRQRGEKI
ncbi:MFS transporter [Brevibacterium luteolum]|uniref:Uncharacterized protein n=1 Tax=Brevibacterium luteolum TaxID=199591 RepID=A0A6G8KUW0_9MICO|nr:MFS transporter [Brevibacterium luteolum]QIN28568.1 hypothetical protein EW640_04210 [Brevibacterium luteolum]